MSISAMEQALKAMELALNSHNVFLTTNPMQDAWQARGVTFNLYLAIDALRQAIMEAEKQEPVAVGYEWKPCVKLPIVVHVREQRKGETHVSTREGITPVKEDDLIMRGVAGEEYPIGRELFNQTYTFDTAPVHASDISQERVDETAKGGQEQKTPLKVLNLTVFTENRLRNGRVYDVETLQTMTNRDILAIPDIGKKALAEVLEALAKLKEQNRG